MNQSHIDRRISHLDAHINDALTLLGQYESLLQTETDPRRRLGHQRDAESLRSSLIDYRHEYDQLQAGFALAPSPNQELQRINAKLDALGAGLHRVLEGQDALRLALVAGFDGVQRNIIGAVVARLDQASLQTVQAITTQIDAGQIREDEMRALAEAVQQLVVALPPEQKLLPERAQVEDVLSDPEIGYKHKLKFSLPVIPFLLEYEGEVEFGSNANLVTLMKKVKDKFRR